MALRLITVSTDGITSQVVLPDGQRYNLGAMPVARLVADLVPHRAQARMILDEYLRDGESSFTADLDRMEGLFAIRRVRWGSASSLIPLQFRLPERRGNAMADQDKAIKDAISGQISEIERMISVIEQKAKDASKGSLSANMMADDIANLRKLVKEIGKAPSGQSLNNSFTASVDTLESNARVADEILDKVDTTRQIVDNLAAAGKPFSATAARTDLFRIASQVHHILTNADLAAPYIAKDLSVLAEQTDHIHGLFAGAK
jgi:hypothetical protein